MAIYNGHFEHDRKKGLARVNKLNKEGATYEIRKINTNYSKKFRGYLHVCLVAYAIEFGETLEWTKQVKFKQHVNPDIYVYERINPKTKEVRKALRSTEEKGIDNVTALERFKNYCVKECDGFILPEPDEKHYIAEILKAEQEYKHFL